VIWDASSVEGAYCSIVSSREGLPPIGLFDVDPHGVAAAYRPACSAVYDDEQQGWFAWRHRDVAALLRDPSFKKDPAVAVDGPYTQALLAGDYSILFMDEPDHRRLRGLVSQAFSKRATETLRPRIQAIADDLLDSVDPTTGSVDLVSALAVPLPVTAIAEILGVDPAARADFKRWSDDVALSIDGRLSSEAAERVARSDGELREYIAGAIRTCRAAPRDDLISALVAVQDADGSRLSDAEAISAIALLLFAGNATTTDLIGNGVLALLEHRDQLDALASNPSLIANAIEEILRYDPPIVVGDRIPTTDFDLDGCPITQGQWVWPALASANRDPTVHPDPDRFDIRREPIHHLSFGGGPHLCLGAPLARMETQIAIGSLVARFPHIRLTDPSTAPNYKFVPGFRGLAELNVTLD
jgi:cytochrome P450